MNATTLTIHWHNDTQPVYSVEFQPHNSSGLTRLVTAGGDNNVRIWQLETNVEYLSTLRKHTQAVNTARFNPNGDILASAGDDGTIMLWKLSPTLTRDLEQQEEDIESWNCITQLRSLTSEINDICWSPNGKFILAGLMDNTSRVYEIIPEEKRGKLVKTLTDHTHYVQGVHWDPLGEYFVTQSADRSVILYNAQDYSMIRRFSKVDGSFMYHSETLQSFFRRLSFSPDGLFLITPAGLGTSEEDNTCYVFVRNNFSTPLFKLCGLSKPATVISFNPVRYKTTDNLLSDLPYKMIFAVATLDAVVIYGTDNFKPLGYVSNLHYSTITDIRWENGTRAIVSSTDGFCLVITFDALFGEVHEIEPTILLETKELIQMVSTPIADKVAVIETTVKENPLKDTMVIDGKDASKIPTDEPVEKTIDAFFKKEKPKKRIAPTLVQ